MVTAGDFLRGDSAWDAVFPLEVATELYPFPLHLFPSLVAPANAQGDVWTALQVHPATPTGPGLEGVMLQVIEFLGRSIW